MTPAPVGIRCPEHSGKPQGIQKVRGPRGGRTAVVLNAVTIGLIADNVAVALVELASGSSASFTNNSIFENGSLFAGGYVSATGHLLGVAHGQWWRLFTAMFLHASFFHLAVNMYSLYFVGSIMEQVIGRWRFCSSTSPRGSPAPRGADSDAGTPTVGASGAIFGVLGGLFILERRRHIATGGQVAGLIVINLVITFAFSSSISVGGHIGGLIGGGALMSRCSSSAARPCIAVAAVAGSSPTRRSATTVAPAIPRRQRAEAAACSVALSRRRRRRSPCRTP